LHYVYEGNVPGSGGENTHCHACHALLVERYGYSIMGNRVRNGHCPQCAAAIPGIWQ